MEKKLNVHKLQLRFSNAYIIENINELFLIDCGIPGDDQYIFNKLETLRPKKLKIIILTHAHIDHAGGAYRLGMKTGAPVAIHEAEVSALESGSTELGRMRGRGHLVKLLLPLMEAALPAHAMSPQITFTDGYNLGSYGLDATIHHTPGHTPGSSSIFTADGILFVGDLLSSSGGAHAQKYFATDWSKIPASVNKIHRLEPA